MSCQQVPTTPAFNPYPRSVQVGEFEVAIGGGIWVAIRVFLSCLCGSEHIEGQVVVCAFAIAAVPSNLIHQIGGIKFLDHQFG